MLPKRKSPRTPRAAPPGKLIKCGNSARGSLLNSATGNVLSHLHLILAFMRLDRALSTPIHNLPVETLSQIFVCLLTARDASTTFPLILRRVCKRWRAVAEQTPDIWTTLVTGHGIEWTRRSLDFSKKTPLDVTLHSQGSAVQRIELETLILSRLYHIRTLVFTATAVPSEVARLFQAPAPLLQKLSINGEWARPSLDLGASFVHTPPPQLTHLRLAYARVPSTCPIFQAPLTHLRLIHCHVWDSVDSFIDTLTSLPQLESFSTELALEDMSRQHDSDSSSSPSEEHCGERLAMARLRAIRLEETIDDLRVIMPRLTLPRDCEVYLAPLLFDVDFDLDDLLASLDTICKPHLAASFQAGDNMDLTPRGFNRMEILEHEKEYRGCNPFTVTWTTTLNDTGHDDMRFRLAVIIEHDDLLSEIVRHALEHWPGTSTCISHLYLSHDSIFSEPGSLTNALEHLGAVTDLDAEGCAARQLLETLYESEGLIPGLESLTLRNLRLTDSAYQACISEMEARRVEIRDPEMRIPRKLTLVNCTVMGKALTRMDVVLSEDASGEDEEEGSSEEDW
ncbi:unnamed protein product [Peniophora sp. CBMAI 1063]|nr:unnamed protein product [Peniophora sp. CBMAI 1063]